MSMQMLAMINELKARVEELEAKVAVLEAKRGPGRPPNQPEVKAA
jgi:outer membrane murein-binding lipoprotein Lpp